MQVAKVFISIYGDEREQEIALEGLKSKAKYVRMGLGKRMSLRMTPEVRFVKDDSLERGSRVILVSFNSHYMHKHHFLSGQVSFDELDEVLY